MIALSIPFSDQERSLQYVQNEYRDAEREIKSDKKRLQFDLKESEVAHESYLKTLKHQLDERVTALRQEFERYAKDIQQKYERKRKVLLKAVYFHAFTTNFIESS